MLIPAHVRRNQGKLRSRWRRHEKQRSQYTGSGSRIRKTFQELGTKPCRNTCEEAAKLSPLIFDHGKSRDDMLPLTYDSKDTVEYDSDYDEPASKISKVEPVYSSEDDVMSENNSEGSDDAMSSGEDTSDIRDIGTQTDNTLNSPVTSRNTMNGANPSKSISSDASEDFPSKMGNIISSTPNSPLIFRSDENNKLFNNCMGILSDYASLEKKTRSLETSIDKNHALSKLSPTGNKKYPQRKCVACRRGGVRRDTRYYCQACPGTPALCRDCFKPYHVN